MQKKKEKIIEIKRKYVKNNLQNWKIFIVDQ